MSLQSECLEPLDAAVPPSDKATILFDFKGELLLAC